MRRDPGSNAIIHCCAPMPNGSKRPTANTKPIPSSPTNWLGPSISCSSTAPASMSRNWWPPRQEVPDSPRSERGKQRNPLALTAGRPESLTGIAIVVSRSTDRACSVSELFGMNTLSSAQPGSPGDFEWRPPSRPYQQIFDVPAESPLRQTREKLACAVRTEADFDIEWAAAGGTGRISGSLRPDAVGAGRWIRLTAEPTLRFAVWAALRAGSAPGRG